MMYVTGLKYDQKPDYKYCIGIFEDYLKANKFVIDEENWDWD